MKITIPLGISIYQAIGYAQSEAFNKKVNDVSFTFNGIDMVVYANSHEYDSALIYSLRCEIERLSKNK